MDYPIDKVTSLYDENEILGIKKTNRNINKNCITNESNIIEFTHRCFERVLKKVIEKEYMHIKNTIFVGGEPVSMHEILRVTSCEDLRRNMVVFGETSFDKYAANDDV